MKKVFELETKSFFWGNHKEFKINEDNFQIYNKNIGLQNSSFQLEEGNYKLIISSESLVFTQELKTIYTFIGTPILSGTEEQNIFLEENQMIKKHIRYYGLNIEKLNILLSKDFLTSNNILDNKIFIYLILKDV